MKITPNEVDKLARLSRLSFTDAERTRMVADMEKILGFVAQINSLDLEGVEPLVYMMDEENVLREDAAVPSLPQAEALRNAPDANSDYFRVPTVLKK
jgi:aspartyl-tRNA(Asn)/glutamyl-tRNA(Gln) amidotransferase subunit C